MREDIRIPPDRALYNALCTLEEQLDIRGWRKVNPGGGLTDLMVIVIGKWLDERSKIIPQSYATSGPDDAGISSSPPNDPPDWTFDP